MQHARSRCRRIVRRRGWPVALLAVFTACGQPAPPVVGIAVGGDFLEGARLAVKDALAAEPTRFDTVVVAEASNLSAPAIQGAERLVSTPGIVGVVGHNNSAASLAASQVYNRRGVAQIAPTSTAPVYDDAGPYSFRLVPSDDRQGAFLADHLSRRYPPGTRIALLYVNDDYGRGLRAAVLDALDPAAYTMVVDLPHADRQIGTDDVEHAVDATVAAAPDVVLWLGRGSSLHRFLKRFRATRDTVPIVGGDAAPPPPGVDVTDKEWSRVRYAEFLDLDGTEALREFRRRYREGTGYPPSGAELLTYDAVGLLIAGIREGAESGESMREYLVSLGRSRAPYQGVTGPIAFDSVGNVRRDFVLQTIRPSEPR